MNGKTLVNNVDAVIGSAAIVRPVPTSNAGIGSNAVAVVCISSRSACHASNASCAENAVFVTKTSSINVSLEAAEAKIPGRPAITNSPVSVICVELDPVICSFPSTYNLTSLADFTIIAKCHWLSE